MQLSKLILWSDDDPARAVLAYQRMRPLDQERTIWCRNVQETISTLYDYREQLDIVSFGHDFEGLKFMNSKSDKSGMEIIRWLENLFVKEPGEFKLYENTKFIIHSWNVTQSLRMIDRMNKLKLNVKYTPFGSGNVL